MSIICKHIAFAFCFCLLLGSCSIAPTPPSPANNPPEKNGIPAAKRGESRPTETEQPDLSCSYFYFLWGTHSEFNQKYEEALEAYEKALICDPATSYVNEKIPILLLKMGEFEKAGDWLRQALIDRPEENSNRLFLASLYIQQGKMAEAIKLYDQVLATDPENESVHLRLGLLYSHQEQYDKAEKIFRRLAEKIFRRLAEKNDGSYFAHLSLARLLRQIEQHKEAGREYEKALQLNWSKDLSYEIGYFYMSQKRYDDAMRLYTAIIEQDPFDERAALSRVQIFLETEKNDQALDELKTIGNFSKNPVTIDIIVSKVLLRKKETGKAKEILLRLARETGNSEARYMLALLAYQENDFPAALDHLGHIRPANSEFEEAVYLQSRIYKETGKTEKAISLLKKHLGSESSRSPLFYALLSSFYQEKKDELAAISLMEAAITIYPDNSQLFFEYGLLLDKREMYEQAMAKMERVLELEPDHADALNYIGYTWADNNIHLDKALDYIKRAADLKPDNGYIIDSLGWVYYRLGEFAKAAKELERSLELEPGDPHIYDHLGDVYRALGETVKAKNIYNKALEMFEDETKKSHVKTKLDALGKE
jgi:tetratricopeptide (TPR) repeat protein